MRVRDDKIWTCMNLHHYSIQQSRVPPLATFLNDNCSKTTENTRKGTKNILGNGSHANRHRADKPVNLCSELPNPGVWLDNDISSSMSLLHLCISTVDPGRSQRDTTVEDVAQCMFMPKYNKTWEENDSHLFILHSTSKRLACYWEAMEVTEYILKL